MVASDKSEIKEKKEKRFSGLDGGKNFDVPRVPETLGTPRSVGLYRIKDIIARFFKNLGENLSK